MSSARQSALYDRPLWEAVKIALADTSAVCLLGPREAGKTTQVHQFESDYGYVTLDASAAVS